MFGKALFLGRLWLMLWELIYQADLVVIKGGCKVNTIFSNINTLGYIYKKKSPYSKKVPPLLPPLGVQFIISVQNWDLMP